jgi:peptidoglycan/xylan/chitin deacetylase (PgdA/CDA1 family)
LLKAGKKVFILNFHGLDKPGNSESRSDKLYWTSPDFFAATLEVIRKRSDVLITFDDSYESDYSIALPLLKASQMSARFFVVAGKVGQPGFLSAQQIQSLRAEGMTIGSHGMYHRKWPGLKDRELHEEIVEARERLEQVIRARVIEAACPFGGYDRRVLERLRASGYQRVYTSDGGLASAESWLQPRNTILRGDDLRKVSGILANDCSGPKAAFRRLKLLLKRWR